MLGTPKAVPFLEVFRFSRIAWAFGVRDANNATLSGSGFVGGWMLCATFYLTDRIKAAQRPNSNPYPNPFDEDYLVLPCGHASARCHFGGILRISPDSVASVARGFGHFAANGRSTRDRSISGHGKCSV